MSRSGMALKVFGISSLCLVAQAGCWAAGASDIAELKRAIEALRAENRALTNRVATLEAEKEKGERRVGPATPAAAGRGDRERLEQRVKELETTKQAQEDATRNIIRQSLSTLGSKINEPMSLGGQIDMTASRSKDFAGQSTSGINLSGSNLEFDIQASDWSFGVLRLDYQDGTGVVFPTTTGSEASVDRINLDQAYITLGDTQRFPALLTAGRFVLPFGISTGRPVTDTLSLASPLTVDVFETKQTAVGFGLGFPTPALKPPTPPVFAPAVKPMVINPLVSSISRSMGYEPPPTPIDPPTKAQRGYGKSLGYYPPSGRPKPFPPVSFLPTPPPFDMSLFLYDSQIGAATRQQFNGSVGFNTRGNCGRRYEELTAIGICPWAVNFDVNYNSSVFDAQFLREGYRSFLPQIGRVPGMAASVKAALGPFSLVGEWNAAVKQARFLNALGEPVRIKPAAWQVSLAYQFDWNPWVQEIGAQGTFLSVAYSQSSDLAGVTALVNDVPTRVGFVPRRRLLFTGGEWVLDTVRVALEYAIDRDYPVSQGGTGRSARGLFASLVYAF